MRVARADIGGSAERHRAKTRLIGSEAGNTDEQNVLPAPEQRRRSLPVAWGIPRARQRFGQALVAAELDTIERNHTGHVQIIHHQSDRRCRIGLLPAKAVPNHSVEARPAQAPVVRQRDGGPTGRGRRLCVPIGANSFDALKSGSGRGGDGRGRKKQQDDARQ